MGQSSQGTAPDTLISQKGAGFVRRAPSASGLPPSSCALRVGGAAGERRCREQRWLENKPAPLEASLLGTHDAEGEEGEHRYHAYLSTRFLYRKLPTLSDSK